jgi:NADH:ubiquinone oxidoreductase subunit K
MAIAVVFGLGSLNYTIGQFSRSGPGLFPLMVSCLLFLIGLIGVVRSRFVKPVQLSYNLKNIAVILLGLCGFVLISQRLNMIVAIVFLVFCLSFAGTSYSPVRNLKISAGLIVVAFMFRTLLGLQLPLF